jgi:hypothetical protein
MTSGIFQTFIDTVAAALWPLAGGDFGRALDARGGRT